MENRSDGNDLKTILHLDMNSYFASVEQQANPYLQGRPVGIIKAIGRGCVIAASVEAKEFGVETGMPKWEATKLCPEIILVPSDMDKYFNLTQRMIEIVKNYSPDVEVFSIDEVFADIGRVYGMYEGGVVEMVYRMKQDICNHLGKWVKCSVGVSFSKLVAKLASEMNKPNGLTFLTRENYLDETENVNVKSVCGIGMSRAKYLYGRGLFTLGRARKVDLPEDIRKLVWLSCDEKMVTDEDLLPAKSVSRTYTTFRELKSWSEVERLVRNLAEEATGKLREMGMAGRTLILCLRSGEGGSLVFRKTLSWPINDGLTVFNYLRNEYLRLDLTSVRFAGLSIGNLVWDNQQAMVDGLRKRGEVNKVADKINQKYGQFSIYPGTLLGGELIRPEVTGFLGDKWYRLGGRKRT